MGMYVTLFYVSIPMCHINMSVCLWLIQVYGYLQHLIPNRFYEVTSYKYTLMRPHRYTYIRILNLLHMHTNIHRVCTYIYI